MKAFLLAAGLGSRLRPITDKIPKCMIEIGGYPMLDWWAKLFKENGVKEVLINTHYLHEQVHDYIENFNKKNKSIKFVEFYEEELLGSGGTIRANLNFIENNDPFLICYADNLCNVNLCKLIAYHKMKKGILTMALFRTDKPGQCGIAAVDAEGKIIHFEEKPKFPKSNLANAGIYVANKELANYFPENGFLDMGKDVLPLLDNMYGFEINDYLIDIGTIDNYERAKREWKYDYYKDSLTR